MSKNFKSFLSLLFLSNLVQAQEGVQTPPGKLSEDCIVRRASLDVGSESTKFRIADVDVCLQKVLAVVESAAERVAYKSDLSKSTDSTFSQEIMDAGMGVINTFKERALKAGATQITGVATSAFRKAKNAKDFVATIQERLNIKIQIISQHEEAILGFYAATSAGKN